MASFIGHAFVAAVATKAVLPRRRILITAMICAVLPDVDAIGFHFGIPYQSFWGHRGFTHSIAFAILTGALASWFVLRSYKKRRSSVSSSERVLRFLPLLIFFFLVTLSHSMLDALTNGGRGVALFSPIENSRYFFSIRPIQVSPIGISSFFSGDGLNVLKSELLYIFLPALALLGVVRARRSEGPVRSVRQVQPERTKG